MVSIERKIEIIRKYTLSRSSLGAVEKTGFHEMYKFTDGILCLINKSLEGVEHINAVGAIYSQKYKSEPTLTFFNNLKELDIAWNKIIDDDYHYHVVPRWKYKSWEE